MPERAHCRLVPLPPGSSSSLLTGSQGNISCSPDAVNEVDGWRSAIGWSVYAARNGTICGWLLLTPPDTPLGGLMARGAFDLHPRFHISADITLGKLDVTTARVLLGEVRCASMCCRSMMLANVVLVARTPMLGFSIMAVAALCRSMGVHIVLMNTSATIGQDASVDLRAREEPQDERGKGNEEDSAHVLRDSVRSGRASTSAEGWHTDCVNREGITQGSNIFHADVGLTASRLW